MESMDIILILDTSLTHASEADWRLELRFIEHLLKKVHISHLNTRVALITYGKSARLNFDFTKYTSKSKLLHAIASIKYSIGKWSDAGDALKLARTRLLPQVGRDASVMVLLVANSKSNIGPDAVGQAKQLKAEGVDIISIGISTEVDE